MDKGERVGGARRWIKHVITLTKGDGKMYQGWIKHFFFLDILQKHDILKLLARKRDYKKKKCDGK